MVGENETIDIPGGDVAVLMLHGLFGTPNELHVLGGQLARAGHAVRIPLLPGRASGQTALDRLGWEDWMAEAVRHFDELAGSHARVVACGVSAGGTMALDLALRRPVAALLLFAPALSLRHRAAVLAPYLWRILPRWPQASGPVGAPGRFERIPVRAVGELVHGMRRVRARVGEIDAPTFVAHATDDVLVPVSSALRLRDGLAGPVELLLRERGGHGITADADREALGEAAIRFLAAHVPLGPVEQAEPDR